MLKKLNGLTFFSSLTFYCLLYAFKIIIIKGIAYVQCQRWVIELSLKRKSFAEIFVIRKKLFYVKRNFMCREPLFLINEEEFKKQIKLIWMKKY